MEEKKYSGVLILAETEHGKVHRVAYELLNKGRMIADACGESLSCLLLAPDTFETSACSELCQRGADQVYVMKSAAFRHPEEVLFAQNIVSFIEEKRPDTVLVGATHLGRSLAPRVAAALGTGLTADCTDLQVDADGNLEQIRPQMATVRYKEFQEAPVNDGAQIQIREIAPYIEENQSVKIEKTVSIGDMDITDAEVVVAGGRGIRKEEDLALLQELADLLGGQVGVSRALVDAGMAPSSIQVGYSGNRVKPKVYIACGISGAPQHLAGMKEADVIIAVNNDPSAPIFNIADYGFVGDLYEVLPQLTEHFRKDGQADER